MTPHPLQPGAELDAEVAKAMGWTNLIDTNWSWRGTPPGGGETADVPEFSGNMDAAWQLIDDSTCLWTWEIKGPLLGEGTRWRCQIELGVPDAEAVCEFADTAPEAICKAFLSAHGPIPHETRVAGGGKERR